jgi:RimJ/RimL family protein N-acetyltransferase
VADLRSGRVRLRPLEPEDIELLVSGRHVGAVPAQSVDEDAARERLRRRIERSGRFVEGRLDLGIVVDGRLAGTIEARRPHEGLPPGVFEIGVSLFDVADRGRGAGTTAVDLFTGYLFSEHGASRVQAGTWVENTAMRRVLEKLGYRCEGVMREFMPADEGRHDYALYAVTRADWLTSRDSAPGGRTTD